MDTAGLPPLHAALHLSFVKSSAEETETMEAVASQHLRLNAVYWGLCCLHLLGAPEETLDRAALRAWVCECQTGGGGFAPAPGHDAHLLSTLSALQVLALLGPDPLLSDPAWCERVAAWVVALQQPDGSWQGDSGGEVDTRFVFAGLASLGLLRRLHLCDRPAAAAFVRSCSNFDGGFGATPGGESHAGQVFTALAALRLALPPGAQLCEDGGGVLGGWLAGRQLACGGLNGRPEKAPDVCYSWWVISSLALLRRTHWIDGRALAGFILEAQDGGKGGIADRLEDEPDVYHTFFGVAGLALLGYPGLRRVDPVYAMPEEVLRALGVALDAEA